MIIVILTGGQSRRMGRDKAMLPLDGQTMSLRLAERFRALGKVYFSVDRTGRFPVGEYGELIDAYPGQGPLNGLVSAFRDTEADSVLLMATDMPDCSLSAAVRLAENIGEHDACIFAGDPLFGLYRRSCYAPAQRLLEENRNAMRALLEQVDVCSLKNDDPALLTNLNTPEEYERYRNG